MQRVAVLGSGGAGKTTFAKTLSEATGLPVVHLDEHYWSPGWIESDPKEWRIRQTRLLSGEKWIVDGNYGDSFDIRLGLVDTIIWLDFPRSVCILSAIRSTLFNLGRPKQAAGCPERFDMEFYKWIWNFRKESRPRLVEAIARCGNRIDVLQFQSRREAGMFIQGLRNPS